MSVRVLLLLLVTLATANDRAHAAVTPRDIASRVGVEQRLGRSLPMAATFRDEQGAQRPLGAFLDGKPAIFALVYFECPNLCTLTLNSLAASLRQVHLRAGRDYEVIAISIDPREGPSLAATKRSAYLSHYGGPDQSACRTCDVGWHFLTGNADDIQAVAGALGYRYFWDAALSQYAHPAGIIVVGSRGLITQYFNGLDFPPSELQRALEAAAAGRTGSLAERLWLLCFHYEALAGRYSAEIGVVLRILALLTVAALGGLLYRLARVTP